MSGRRDTSRQKLCDFSNYSPRSWRVTRSLWQSGKSFSSIKSKTQQCSST